MKRWTPVSGLGEGGWNSVNGLALAGGRTRRWAVGRREEVVGEAV